MKREAPRCQIFSWFLQTLLALFFILVSTGCSNQPAELAVDTSSLDFGETSNELPLQIINMGNQPLTWKITLEESVSWCTFNPGSGTDDGTVTVTVNRSMLARGDNTCEIVIKSDGGTIKVPVSASGPTGGIEINEPLPE